MKYLKEFATEAEYEAYVAGTSFVRPNASFVQETATMHYTDILKPGVYIMHTDGGVYTKDQWIERGFAKSEGFGIVVNDAKAKIIIPKTYYRQLKWMSVDSMIEGIATTTQYEEAITDYNGQQNTAIMLETGKSAAANSIASFTSPLGASAYIGAAGEWKVAHQYLSEINYIISNHIGGDRLGQFNEWTSTQYSENRAWIFSQTYSDYFSSMMKTYDIVYVRPFYPFV